MEITVRIPSLDKSVTLEVKPDHTVDSIIKILHDGLDLSKDDSWILVHHGIEIGYDKKLGDIGIVNGGQLELIQEGRLKIAAARSRLYSFTRREYLRLVAIGALAVVAGLAIYYVNRSPPSSSIYAPVRSNINQPSTTPPPTAPRPPDTPAQTPTPTPTYTPTPSPTPTNTTPQTSNPSEEKTVDWVVYNPSATPTSPTTNDFVNLNVWLRFASTISPGPYPVYVVCTVDGVQAGAGTMTVSGTSPNFVTADTRKYSPGTHIATWAVDPNFEYNDINRGNNKVIFQFTVID